MSHAAHTALADQAPSAGGRSPSDLPSDDLLTSRSVRNALGGISEMTLWRHTRNLGFPLPDVIIARRKFWRRSTVERWIAAQAERMGRVTD